MPLLRRATTVSTKITVLRGPAYVLAHVGIADEELRAQVVFGHVLVVGEGDGANACQHKVLRNLVG